MRSRQRVVDKSVSILAVVERSSYLTRRFQVQRFRRRSQRVSAQHAACTVDEVPRFDEKK
jgi:hypothetical protein